MILVKGVLFKKHTIFFNTVLNLCCLKKAYTYVINIFKMFFFFKFML